VSRVTWFVLEVRPKAERKALTELRKAGIVDAYCPEYKIERFNRRRKVRIVTTLCHFPRYIFAQLEGRDFGALRGCNSIIDVLPGYPHPPMALSKVDVKALDDLRDAEAKHLLDDTDQGRRARGETVKNTLEAMRKRLKGKKVRVKDGPFTSFPGTVDVIHSLDRLTVLIDIFGRPTPVDLQVGQYEEMAA
jgi:transcriptional antiterminator NusG